LPVFTSSFFNHLQLNHRLVRPAAPRQSIFR
jgi:hypothetical protein